MRTGLARGGITVASWITRPIAFASPGCRKVSMVFDSCRQKQNNVHIRCVGDGDEGVGGGGGLYRGGDQMSP